MDVRQISAGVVSGSPALSSLSPDFDERLPLARESEIFATKARGSCGVDPGPARVRIETLSASFRGDLLYGESKRLGLVRSLMFSTFAMVRFTACTVSRLGGGTDLALMRPRKGSPGAGVFELVGPSSSQIRQYTIEIHRDTNEKWRENLNQSDGRLLYIGVATSDSEVSESRPWRVCGGALRFERNRLRNMADETQTSLSR